MSKSTLIKWAVAALLAVPAIPALAKTASGAHRLSARTHHALTLAKHKKHHHYKHHKKHNTLSTSKHKTSGLKTASLGRPSGRPVTTHTARPASTRLTAHKAGAVKA